MKHYIFNKEHTSSQPYKVGDVATYDEIKGYGDGLRIFFKRIANEQ